MPARNHRRPAVRPAPIPQRVDDPAVARALDDQAAAVRRAGSVAARVTMQADLVVGDNRINHGLGRRVSSIVVTPSALGINWKLTSNDDTQVVITLAGTPQPGALLEFS